MVGRRGASAAHGTGPEGPGGSGDGTEDGTGDGAGDGTGPGAGPTAGRREDAALLAAHLAGDPDAFGELARRHGDRLWRVAYGVLGDREEASDAVQDAVVSALRAADRFRGEAAVTTWLHRITVNASLDRIRRARVRRTVPLEGPPGPDGEARRAAEHAAPGDATADVDLGVDVRAALAQLPAHQREALVLVDLEDLSVARAAAELGVAVGTVKSRCSRGRAAMAVLLRERGLDPRRVPGPGNRDGLRRVPEDGAPPGEPDVRPGRATGPTTTGPTTGAPAAPTAEEDP